MGLLTPDWALPASVGAITTLRSGGVSLAPWNSFNLGAHVGDNPLHVAANRQRLVGPGAMPAQPVWLEQVHGTDVIHLRSNLHSLPRADAVYTRERGLPCAVMTADCLPVLFCSADGKEIAAAHAGWRGLCAGILENTLSAFRASAQDIVVWLGPAIGPQAFEVGAEVRDAFVVQNSQDDAAFLPVGEKYYADIWQLATNRLIRSGVRHITGGGLCTWSEPERFFSFRRDGVTGRLVSAIWLR